MSTSLGGWLAGVLRFFSPLMNCLSSGMIMILFFNIVEREFWKSLCAAGISWSHVDVISNIQVT